jgi:hypothetical protein
LGFKELMYVYGLSCTEKLHLTLPLRYRFHASFPCRLHNQIPVEFIQAGDETLPSEIHRLVNYIWYEGELLEEWNESTTVPT